MRLVLKFLFLFFMFMFGMFMFGLEFHLGFSAATTVQRRDHKMTCSHQEITRQDCTLKAGDDKLRLLPETVVWNNGIWHAVDTMPLRGEGTQWEKMRFDSFRGWPVLQLWIWGKISGEARIQSLNWYVMDWSGQKARILASGVVRKRRLKPAGAGHDQAPTVPVPSAYIYDDWEVHGLKVQKEGRIEWTLGREKKILERTDHGI
jgi:hypothetical protein